MKIYCSNPECTQSVGALALRLKLPGSGETIGNQWYCSRKCFNSHIADKYIEDKRCGLKKTVRRLKLGMLLVKKNIIDKEQLSIALEEKSGSWKKVGEILVEQGHITEKDLKAALSLQAGVAPINLEPQVKIKLKEELPYKIIKEFQFVVFDFDERNRVIHIAVYDTDFVTCLEEYFAKIYPGYLVKFYLEDQGKIKSILSRNYVQDKAKVGVTAPQEVMLPSDGPALQHAVVRFVQFLNEITGEEIKIDHLDKAVWIKGETKDLKIDIYLTRKWKREYEESDSL